jgi:class 3 adenylate cyclase
MMKKEVPSEDESKDLGNGNGINNGINHEDHSLSKGAIAIDDSTDGGSATTHSTKKLEDNLDSISKCMKSSRIIIVTSLLIMGAIAGGLTHYFTSQQEEQQFENQSATFAFKVEEALHYKSKTLQGALETFAVTIASYARSNDDTEWPFETFPFYESVAAQFRTVSSTDVIVLAPLVEPVLQGVEWPLYSFQEQGWLNDSYEAMGWTSQPFPIRGQIYDIDSNGLVVSSDPTETAMPLWQRSEPPKDTSIINYNLLSQAQVRMTFKALVETQLVQGQMGPVMDLGGVLGDNGNEKSETPESLYVQPVLDMIDGRLSMVATLTCSMEWNDFFTGLIPDDANGAGGFGMVVVVESTCPDNTNSLFTYALNGRNPIFMGYGDHHDPAYNDLGHTTGLFYNDIQENNVCDYALTIYPTATVEEQMYSNQPAIYTAVMVMLFVLAAVFFLVYDYFVQRQQREAMAEAARSNAIVSSLFPAEIRDRLFNTDNNNNNDGGTMTVKNESNSSKDIEMGAPDANKRNNKGGTAQKFRLQNFLDEEGEKDAKMRSQPAILESKPIADLFPNMSVLFADISGFTAWSSVREPAQVFTLLETVYKAFDKTAKRRKVFKVETVGDCYVAVTGLPEPVKDHSVIMCRFARECLTQFNHLVTQLEVILGPDTGDLNVRIGIHSGPVTAGVLRGDKSRFQLFGDTVNTAARIETSGLPNRIHLSHETAELFHAAGKSNWMSRRTDTIVAKGKGEMQTYWLLTDEELAAGGAVDASATKSAAPLPIVHAMQPRLAKNTMDVLDPESSLPPRIKRLVDWNVDVLKRLLKQIVAKRNADANAEKYDLNHPVMMKHEMNIGSDTYVLSEVTEIIRLPGYRNVKMEENPNKVILPDIVESQLRLYVASVAAMHRDNPFHNFEHASHVMMSVSKLLSRIVAPDDVLQGDDANLHDHTYGITGDPLTQFSVVLAALIHDVDHSGVSNAQLIKEGAKIADVFKNKSVAEQNSIVLAWDRLMESRFSTFRGCIYANPE